MNSWHKKNKYFYQEKFFNNQNTIIIIKLFIRRWICWQIFSNYGTDLTSNQCLEYYSNITIVNSNVTIVILL